MVQSGTAGVRLPRPCPTHRTASRMWVARAVIIADADEHGRIPNGGAAGVSRPAGSISHHRCARFGTQRLRSEEHTSELQSRRDLVCRLLLEKKKKKINR